jgi:hypothetical protein
MAVTPPKKGRGWDLANTNIQEWIKLFQGVGVMKVYISPMISEACFRSIALTTEVIHIADCT